MFLVFDTETTDLPNFRADNPGMSKARIVQLAALLLDPEFNEVATFSSLIKLEDGIEIAPGAQAAHGISLERCRQYGIPIKAALSVFDEFAKLADYVVAFNLKFDTYLLSTEMILSGRALYNIANGTSGICCMLASTDICGLRQKNDPSKKKWPKLQEAAKILLGLDMTDAHDALYDCRITSQVLRYLLLNSHISLPTKAISQV